jgi:hypothetical protein
MLSECVQIYRDWLDNGQPKVLQFMNDSDNPLAQQSRRKEGNRGEKKRRKTRRALRSENGSKLPIPMNDCSFSKRSDLLILLITHMHESLTIPGTSHFCAIQNLRNSEMSFNTKY